VFADASGPQSAGWALAKNIRVATNNGIRYLRGDVPPHVAGPVVVWLQWNDGTNVWQNTGPYTYTIALTIGTAPRPAQTTEAVSVTTGFWEPLEAPYAGTSVVDFSIPELSGNPPPLLPVAGTSVSGVPWVNATAVTKVTLRPGQLPNNGPYNWLYYTSSTARVGTVAVNRNEPLGQIEFTTPQAVDVHLWKTGVSTSGSEVGMVGSAWKVYRDSATSPGTPDTSTTVTAFGTETTNPNTSVPSRKQGWFTASLTPGTYWLVETKAPVGFQLMAQPVQFTVATGGAVTLGTGKSGLTRVSNDWDSGSTFNTIVVLDPGATRLPVSGSSSALWITWIGIGIVGLGALLVLRWLIVRRRAGARASGL
jgi:LPXTG-motif cell wall-anchored protein